MSFFGKRRLTTLWMNTRALVLVHARLRLVLPTLEILFQSQLNLGIFIYLISKTIISFNNFYLIYSLTNSIA